MRRVLVVVVILGAVGMAPQRPLGAERIHPKGGCRANPAVVGPCFEVRGRAFASNGTPSIRIQREDTKRVLGLLPAENEIAPECLRKEVTSGKDVVGRFIVCPFTREKAGSMQMVCVEDVSDAVVRAIEPVGQHHIPERKLEGCHSPKP